MTIAPEETDSPAYETDFHAWLGTQAQLLREGRLAQADVEHIAEEMESLGRSHDYALKSRLYDVLLHLLIRNYWAKRRTRRWNAALRNERLEMADILTDSPSLKPKLAEALASGYAAARKTAAGATGVILETFPAHCPFTLDQVLDEDFLDLPSPGRGRA